MKIDILTLFPQMFEGFISESIIKRAREKQLVEINIHDLREYSPFKNKQVDDYPYGGGAGMVLMCEPVYNAIESLREENSLVIMMTPSGQRYNQKIATKLTDKKHLILLCGHYEGFDERIRNFVDLEISIGDYILTGGEIPAMAITDSIVRLIPGTINKESLEYESFNDDFLDYPEYTRPRIFKGMEVPEVLLSGHHENIKKYREEQRRIKTEQLQSDIRK